ncbi:GSCOCG00006240001-RA-CDS [Cotesia congregata]|nr:GSCOCG00006240001-RA-CDS [Cotesia congregata]
MKDSVNRIAIVMTQNDLFSLARYLQSKIHPRRPSSNYDYCFVSKSFRYTVIMTV